MSPQRKAGESLSAQDVQALDETAQVESVEDIDIDTFLATETARGSETALVHLPGGTIRIAAITEAEENALIRAARKPDKSNPQRHTIDMLGYRRAYVAKSLSKASNKLVLPEQMERVLPGTLTKLQAEIQKLSGYEAQQSVAVDPLEYLT